MIQKNSQSGRSMVEMIAVIAIIGIMAISGITTVHYINSYYDSSRTAIEVDNIAKNIIDTYSWKSNYNGLNVEDFCEDSEFSSCLKQETEGVDDTFILNNVWGGTITLSSVGDTHSLFSIQYTNVNESACEQLLDTNFNRVIVDETSSDCENGTILFISN